MQWQIASKLLFTWIEIKSKLWHLSGKVGQTDARKNQYCSTKRWNCRIRAHSILNILYWWRFTYEKTSFFHHAHYAINILAYVYACRNKKQTRNMFFFVLFQRCVSYGYNVYNTCWNTAMMSSPGPDATWINIPLALICIDSI